MPRPVITKPAEPQPAVEPPRRTEPTPAPARETDLWEDLERAWGRTGLSTMLTRTLLRLAALAILITLFCMASAVGYVFGQPAERRARVEILYQPSPTAVSSSTSLDREFATQEVILRGRSVLGPVARTTDVSLDDLEESVAVQVVPGTEVLRVTVSHRDRDTAVLLAQRVAQTYIGTVIVASTVGGREDTQELEDELRRLTTQLDEVETQADVASARGRLTEESSLRSEAAVLLQRIGTVRDRLGTLPGERAGGAPNPRIVVPAYALRDETLARAIRAAAAGALVGMLISSVLLTFLASRRRG